MLFSGHGRPLSGLAWHHIAKNTLATTSQDTTARLWDVMA
jgi:WD40 repeat protein